MNTFPGAFSYALYMIVRTGTATINSLTPLEPQSRFGDKLLEI